MDVTELPIIQTTHLSDEEREILRERREAQERKAAADRLASRIPACAVFVVDAAGTPVALHMPPS